MKELELGGAPSALSWPVILPEPWWHQCVQVTELGEQGALQDGGRAIQHCVGAYAELRLADEGRRNVICQYRGVRNGPPLEACERGLAALLVQSFQRSLSAEKKALLVCFCWKLVVRSRSSRLAKKPLRGGRASSHFAGG